MRARHAKFLSGTMIGDTCVLANKGGGKGGDKPSNRRKREAPTFNLESFAIDNTPFFAVQSKPVNIFPVNYIFLFILFSGLHYYGGSL